MAVTVVSWNIATRHEPWRQLLRMDAVGNGAGLPSISVPSGFSESGLPIAIQFMGRAHAENTVLALARAYQSRTEWHRRHPPDMVPEDAKE